MHLITSELIAKGFGAQLLASLFRFEDDDRAVYLIYATSAARSIRSSRPATRSATTRASWS